MAGPWELYQSSSPDVYQTPDGRVGITIRPSSNEESPEQFLSEKIGDPRRASGLNPTFASGLTRAVMDFEDQTGQTVNLNSLKRSTEEQARLYARFLGGRGGLAAPPGRSRHEVGEAGDIPDGPFLKWMHQNANNYGLEFLNGNAFSADPGHVQLARDMQAQDMSARQQMSAKPWEQYQSSAQPQAPAPQEQPSFASRFSPAMAQPASDQMRAPLEARAEAMMRGPQQPPTAQVATDFTNVLPAATQGTTPDVTRYKGRLISNEAFESDSGEVMYRDPGTGQVVPTDTKTQIAIRDPRDGVVKIFARGDDTNEGGAVGVARVLSQGLGAGAPTARPGLAAPSLKSATPRASEIFATAKPHYQAFKETAGAVSIGPDMSKEFAVRIRDALNKANFIEDLAKPVYAATAILEDGKIGKPVTQAITLDQLQNVKRVIGRSFNSPDKNVRDAAAVASREVGKIIAEVSRPAAQSLRTADEIHSTARSVQDLQRKKEIAGLRTGSAGYGGNAVNHMRQVLKPIVEKSINGRTTGFRPDEIAAMREIVDGTNATNTLRGIGQMSPSKGILATAFGGATAGASAAVGIIANKSAAILTGKQIERLQELVAKRSPAYAEAVAKALERYEKAQAAFVSNPAPNTLAGYLSASRSLSAGFGRDGIQISSGDLMRTIQGPVKSAADGENPEPEGVLDR